MSAPTIEQAWAEFVRRHGREPRELLVSRDVYAALANRSTIEAPGPWAKLAGGPGIRPIDWLPAGSILLEPSAEAIPFLNDDFGPKR